MALAARRLPNITFAAGAPEAPDALPAMDVAAFVGFASSGPIDVPVALHDQVRFEEVFGDDVLLARTLDGEPVFGHLAASVRAFFRHGGRKCYVVRVASDDATCGAFLVPGLMELRHCGSGDRVRRSATLWARSEGSWSDGMRVGAVLHREPYVLGAVSQDGDRIQLTLKGGGTPLPQKGDLIRVDQASSRSAGGLCRSTRLFLFVDETSSEHGKEPEKGPDVLSGDPPLEVVGSEHWFEVVGKSEMMPPAPLRVKVKAADRAQAPDEPAEGVQASESKSALWFLPGEPGEAHRLVVPVSAGIDVGSLVEVEYRPDGERPGEDGGEGAQDAPIEQLLAGIVEIWEPSQEELASIGDPGTERWRTALAREVLAPVDPEEGRSRITALGLGDLRADRLTFDLWTTDERGKSNALRHLGFSPSSPRFVGFLPSDRLLYGSDLDNSPASDGPPLGHALWTEADHPRFPLAAWHPREDEVGSPGSGRFPLFLPIGMEQSRRIEATAGRNEAASGSTLSATVRSGLDRFSADLFLDPDLAGASQEGLADAAFHKQFVTGKPLRKLHAVMALHDVTLLSAPDAVQAPWEAWQPVPVRVLDAPKLQPVDQSEAAITLRWTPVAPALTGPVGYLVEEASDPQFATITRKAKAFETSLSIPVELTCPAVRYFRVRAEEHDEVGPWSNTELALVPRRDFEECDVVLPPDGIPAAPELEEAERWSDGSYRLRWTAVDPPSGGDGAGAEDDGELHYVIVQAQSPDLSDGQVVYRGSDNHARIFLSVCEPSWGNPNEGALYFRVRAEAAGRFGPWSNSVKLVQPTGSSAHHVVTAIADGSEARRVHIAMLNLCAARSDMTSLLSVPAGYDSERAAAYVAELSAAFGAGRDRALGFGAIYSPWTWVTQMGRPARLIPPEGAVAGVIAQRTLVRGAWIAPANTLLQDVVALEFEASEPDLERLYGNGANLILKEARGYTVTGADTLSRDVLVRPLSVHRLLILIRKIAQREGHDMIFAANDGALRRRIRRRFESILSDLFVRGAFAGRVPDDGFRVVIDDSPRVQSHADRGVVIVEIRVAPSRPLEFLTVRLLQTERGQSPVVEVV